jgi:predicted RNase H-like HicB family nuclease
MSSSEVEAIVRPKVRVILEQGETSWGAYVPSIPGCVAVAPTREAVQRKIESALTFHLGHLHQDALAEAEAEKATAQ